MLDTVDHIDGRLGDAVKSPRVVLLAFSGRSPQPSLCAAAGRAERVAFSATRDMRAGSYMQYALLLTRARCFDRLLSEYLNR